MLTDLYPPVAFGGYELECAALVEGLRGRHEMLVLTSTLRRSEAPPDPVVHRELPWVGGNRRVRETLRAPLAAVVAAGMVRRRMAELRPDLVYVSNCVGVPQAAVLTAVASGVPAALRLSETFFATQLFKGDRFLRHLHPGDRGARGVWGAGVRATNRLHPALRLDPFSGSAAAISWASRDLRGRTVLPDTLRVVLERVIKPASRHADALAGLRLEPSAQPSILYLGRVTEAKGIDVACRALAMVRDRHGLDARLVVVGHSDPGTERRVRRLVARLGVDDHVTLHGPVPPDEVAGHLAAAHVVVVPSVVPDVFPLVVVEAGLAGVPIVASRVGGIPEAVKEGEEALLFEAGDAAQCAAALARTIGDPVAARRRARAAHDRMRGLSMERYVSESERFLTDAVRALTAGR